MKTKVRNILLLSVALVLVLSFCLAFFGCGGDGGENDDEESTGTEVQVGADGSFDRESGKAYIHYNYNLSGVDESVYIVAVDDNTRYSADMSYKLDGYKLIGWYTDAACTTLYTSGRVYEGEENDVYLYALWYKGTQFEAEYTNVEDESGNLRTFQGYSQGGRPIFYDTTASNNYYVGDIYGNELGIYFDITSDVAVDDAYIALCVAMEFGWNETYGSFTQGYVSITSNQFTLMVNEKKYSYTTMNFSGATQLVASDKTNWQLIELTSVPLQAGVNTIEFTVNNTVHGQGGTQEALAPVIDYMMVYAPTSVSLTWEPCTDNLEKYVATRADTDADT